MKSVDYSKLTLDELVVMDKVDICQVIKYFKEDLINLNVKFRQFKGYSKRLIVGQWVVFLSYEGGYMLQIVKTCKIAEVLHEEYFYSPQDINEYIDMLKKDRMRARKGYKLTIDGNFKAYNEDYTRFSDTLYNSCMNGKARRYYDLQECLENSTDLQICTLRDFEGILVARTLIWKGQYYDRIYANSNALVVYVQELLRERGFGSVYYTPNDMIDVPLSKELGKYPVPYMDSVCYYYSKEELSLSSSRGDYTALLQEVDGESCFNIAKCSCCGTYTSHNSAYYVERQDLWVCSDCSDEVVYAEDTHQTEYLKDCVKPVDSDYYYFYTDDLYYAEDTGDYYSKADYLYYTEDTENYYTTAHDIYYAEDTGLYYENANDLYYTEDTNLYYENADDLYYTEDTREWFESNESLFYNKEKDIYIKGGL